MENQTETVDRRRRVILFPLPYQGHINPMLQLANLLYSKGFSITILHTNYNKPKTSNYPHFTFRFILDNDPHDERYSNLPLHGMGALSRVLLFNQYGADQLCLQLEQELSAKDEPSVSCLITDALWHFAQLVADSLSLPRLVLRTSSLFSFLIYASIPLLDDRGYLSLSDNTTTPILDGLGYHDLSDNTTTPILDGLGYHDLSDNKRLEEQVEEFPMLKVKDIVKMGFKREKDGVVGVIDNMVKQMKASSGIIWNSFKELEESELETVRRDIPAPSFPIPFAKHFTASSSSLLEHDRSFFPWLDQQPPKSVVYVSFGSIAQVEEKHFMEMVHGLVDSKQSFLWVVRPGFVSGSTWLEPLPDGFQSERGRIVKWAPQQEVLGHEAIGAFWTHCGWNSTLESVCEGVPMICSPFRGDQPLDARYVSDVWKVGVYLENGWKREEITNAIRRVMADEEMRERSRILKQKLDASLIEGGSSYESVESLVAYVSSF
ncbi:putative UDP-glucuronosyl/UDP-glucosyltransferase [Helianthus annuus]|uniref:UDP-glucuronosyl/UDP-glucosyltransferase n=1 Tax=Helianthus annuus TaxID=4232 RepID=A0A9K3ECC3_HELAN|nr:putative UDP-glucuronosyl/UDP-glucosyltransferase [Helianthus annuus]KAJ0465833.1 putative UDP-glucuronosyl/UDP-glucosyltransferase [Helianthus annuus]KAJ0470746.1 putative UDP-glucuronosyl/UDP-glucosyltransferase [Helianthus annuus]KAJ0487423.1 putative UDP-glucuronosyl/UDP-glucosyltransferase [Helianthus annuus]KAJ0657866.1 putative UDP-glucuronosyl/UDP-glucosyltransferase [Helianthus annuus]